MRKEDWPICLDAVIEAAQARPFQWGEHDCALFALQAVEAMTGVDYSDGARGSYNSEIGAAKAFLKRGYRDVVEAASDTFGPPINKFLAQRGDLLSYEGAVGVCVGAHGAFVTAEGLRFIPVSECVMAWKVA